MLDLVPHPRRITLDGEAFRASELTVGDIARIEGWMRDASPLSLPADPPEDEGREFPARLRGDAARYLASEGWPPEWGTPASERLLATPEGEARVLFASLRRHNPGFTLAHARDLAGLMTDEEWSALAPIAYGSRPADAFLGRLAAATEGPPQRSDDAPMSWQEAACEVVTLTGLPPREVAKLTLSQVRAIRTGGGRKPRKLRPKPGRSLRDCCAARSRLFKEAREDMARGQDDVARRPTEGDGPPADHPEA